LRAGAGLGIRVQKIEIKRGINPCRKEGKIWLKMVQIVVALESGLVVNLNHYTISSKPVKKQPSSTCQRKPILKVT
jgi:hypothetical protein